MLEDQNPDPSQDPTYQDPAYDPYASVRAIYNQVTGGKYQPTQQDLSQWGTNLDSNYLSKILSSVQNWWTQYQAQQPSAPTTPTTTPAPTSGPAPAAPAPSAPPDQTPPDIMNAPLTKPYPGPSWNPDGQFKNPYGDAPTLAPIPKFQAPSVADALQDPGYQFRAQQGEDAVQRWAAAKGTLADSSTAKALNDYGQSAASQEYANVFDRSLSAYNTNVTTQYMDPYNASKTAYDTNYTNAWNRYLTDMANYKDWQTNVWNKLYPAATA